MSCASFGRSALFAALAALGWIPWIVVAGPVAGVWGARLAYLGAVTVFYVACLSPRDGRRLAAAALTALVASTVALAARTPAELSIGLAVIVAVARSAFVYPAAPARAVAREALLVGGGLVFARFLAGYSMPSTALALWGFLLVQSFFFLFGRGATRSVAARQYADPFEEACKRAFVLLERSGV